MSLPSYRTNVTNKAQTDLEVAEHENGAPVFMNDTTRIKVGGNQGGSERDVAGVVMPAHDRFGCFCEQTIGKA